MFAFYSILFKVVNIEHHEKPQQTRTALFDVFGENSELDEFDLLLEKCTRANRDQRPRNAIDLRNEEVLVVSLYRIENGERPSDIVAPPFEDEKDRLIRKKDQFLQNH